MGKALVVALALAFVLPAVAVAEYEQSVTNITNSNDEFQYTTVGRAPRLVQLHDEVYVGVYGKKAWRGTSLDEGAEAGLTLTYDGTLVKLGE